MRTSIPPSSLDAGLAALGDIPADERSDFFDDHAALLERDVVRQLTDEVPNLARTDLGQSERLVDAAAWMAERLDDDFSRGRSARAAGHVAQVAGRYAESLAHYERALALFRRTGDELEIALTQMGAIHPLIYAGRYDEAYARAAEARAILVACGDRLRLARLETNVGNILYRQDRVEDALAHYQRAYEFFVVGDGTPQDLAVTLRNLAVCYISLNQFEPALRRYREARDCCKQHEMWRLVLENDYNIAYLYYLRGEYTRAIELYNATRIECRIHGDRYHHALCDLDQSELYLELNLTDEGEKLAREAFAGFERLGLRYEAAKALAFLAIASSQQGRPVKALRLFDMARQRFVAEGNAVWPALIDLYMALVLFDEARYVEASRGAEAALAAFETPAFATKAALAELLIARVRLHTDDARGAEAACRQALVRIQRADSPGLVFQAHVVLGQICEQLGECDRAFRAYQHAHEALEMLRSHLAGDELKIAFIKNKLVVFEGLVHLLLTGTQAPDTLQRAFAYIEQAKSRSLADLISFRAHALVAPNHPRSDLVDRIRQIRQELNWYYHQIDLGQLKPDAPSLEQVQTLRTQTRSHERQLIRLLDDLRGSDDEFHSLQHGGTVDLDAIRASVPADALLVEFYEARGILYVALIGGRQLEILPLTPSARIRNTLRLLTFQLSKFRLGREYVARFERPLHDAALQHLHALFTELFTPIRHRLDAAHLIVVPHDFLHRLPFHALFDGRKFLCDHFSVSYAPSASVYHLCCTKPHRYDESSLVLGVPDATAPYIADEARAVGAALPNARVYLGEEVTEARLREEGRHSRYLHIAAHGYFRHDNPMFSSIRLGQSQLTLFDIYRLELSAELVALSGCGTGLNVVVAGDEMLGLTRGLLYAGAHALLLTLWEVNDHSTAAFMTRFYEELKGESCNKAAALQRTMQALRDAYPHPYHWAPFVLAGDFQRRAGAKPAGALIASHNDGTA